LISSVESSCVIDGSVGVSTIEGCTGVRRAIELVKFRGSLYSEDFICLLVANVFSPFLFVLFEAVTLVVGLSLCLLKTSFSSVDDLSCELGIEFEKVSPSGFDSSDDTKFLLGSIWLLTQPILNNTIFLK
jgi:hypothetical protein